MRNEDKNQNSSDYSYVRDHMANERTFLAWIRTSIGIMVLGFVVERFALFIKQISFLLGTSYSQLFPNTSASLQGYSSIFGIFLVALGVIISLLAFIQYKKVEKQIESNTYQTPKFLNVILTLSVVLIGVFLLFYLNRSV